ncbi:peptide ABC transporter substrate-binding protein [Listeria ilorinensis]|uniref:peptide ABC transporter substrate-binding protein n=1 Tax=Listeria ilorinensis TaxID=2867439 RepID=UPI003EBCD579
MLLGFTVLTACGASDEKKDTIKSNKKTEVNIMETSGIPNASPTLADNSVSFRAINQIGEGLYRLDKDGKPALAMAESEPEVSENGKRLIFKIREDANWSNGEPVTAADFEYAWKKVVDPKTAAAYGPQMEEIVKNATPILKGEMSPDELGVRALDEKTLQVDLENPVPIFKELLTTATFFPQNEEFVEQQGKKYGTSSETLLSNGPFILKNWNGTNLTWDYVKNPDYWDKANVPTPKIHVTVVKDTNAALNLYNTGKLDRVELDGEFVKQYQKDPNFRTSITGRSVYVKMNQGTAGETTVLANSNLRRALAMSLDKQGMVDTLLANGSKPLDGDVPGEIMFDPEMHQDFRKQNGSLLGYDKEAAKKYFEQALSELGKDQLTLTITSGDTTLQKKQTEFMQNQWETNLPGLSIKIKNVTNQASFQADVTQDFELLLGGWGGDYQDPLTYLNLFLTGSPGNHTGFSDATYDELVLGAKGKLSNQPEERWQALLRAEQILLKDQAVLIPLYQGGRAYLQIDQLKNYVTYPIGAENYKWIEKK